MRVAVQHRLPERERRVIPLHCESVTKLAQKRPVAFIQAYGRRQLLTKPRKRRHASQQPDRPGHTMEETQTPRKRYQVRRMPARQVLPQRDHMLIDHDRLRPHRTRHRYTLRRQPFSHRNLQPHPLHRPRTRHDPHQHPHARQQHHAVLANTEHLRVINRHAYPCTSQRRHADRLIRTHPAILSQKRPDSANPQVHPTATTCTPGFAIAAAPTGDRLVGLEALRHGLTAAIDVDHDEWPDIVAAYGRCYYQQPHDQVMTQLGRHLAVLQHQIAVDQGERRPLLLKAAGQLSVIIALGLVASGQAIAARRWWHTARRVADESGDPDAQIMVRAWDVVNGSYDGRPAVQVVAVSDEVLPLLDGRASAATCGLLAGRAQALSLAGRHAEAVATVQHLARMAEQLPATVVDDVESLWGWPEHRLRHTESWVYTHAADYRRAGEAQDRALALYPASQIRLRTQVELHRAAALIRTGHVPANLLDRLPTSQHNELVRSVARQVVVAVPDSERRQSSYRELLERVRS